ncbi:MAG: tRNA (adenosine(37)-N6)-threonylcarbamoyltransferase complex ATPase subunit type 1 TsaE [Deltaproteobacteria bacterium]|nr:MAG: tRNA (adenosine(37)-N6)-threonylcarbamoyltransferase complex ATPase subunit type 1 TsaE [Deltaproteobacteria bacterium]PIE73468.1 MAG: tRNA (adenosine(37)-N6)-threonylcarbamoyltransferase complex ATPase subunit type 1 TsaE [Deltaproteobacteria bacterium]
MYQFSLHNLSETERFGHILGRGAQPGFLYCLDGDLGAGKTTLTQYIAEALGLEEKLPVSSPSFAIMLEYRGPLPLYHMDFYRLYSADDVLGLGLDEYFYKRGLCVVEWGKRAAEILPDQQLGISLEVCGESQRLVSLRATTDYRRLLEEIQQTFI